MLGIVLASQPVRQSTRESVQLYDVARQCHPVYSICHQQVGLHTKYTVSHRSVNRSVSQSVSKTSQPVNL